MLWNPIKTITNILIKDIVCKYNYEFYFKFHKIELDIFNTNIGIDYSLCYI